MHTAAFSPRGGVARRAARLRGQSTIEYVLIIAVISLVVVFAGPQVSGAIRNQFAGVANTLAGGIHGSGSGLGGTSGGGSGGNTPDQEQKDYLEDMKTVTDKDPKDWTFEDQKKAAEDIAEKGTASVAFPKAKAAMDAGTKFSMELTDGRTLEYRIIGINHDDLADGSGKAGLTFLTTSTTISSRMNATNSNAGGWEKSELRAKMNSGEIWNLMPSDFQSKVKSVNKLTNNVGGGSANKNAAVTATSDKLFLLSYSEIVPTSYWASSDPWTSSEGTQYEAFKDKVTENYSGNDCLKFGDFWWERSATPSFSGGLLTVDSSGNPLVNSIATNSYCVCPAWCF
ncbi:DUF6273 domain-containing protein [Collinsella sp. HCP3S3_B1]|uniref:DUF6273 domain-containing protein n=1 Tax=unclassified Collinsella TaxID=2637548 RepID=UPI003F8CA144